MLLMLLISALVGRVDVFQLVSSTCLGPFETWSSCRHSRVSYPHDRLPRQTFFVFEVVVVVEVVEEWWSRPHRRRVVVGAVVVVAVVVLVVVVGHLVRGFLDEDGLGNVVELFEQSIDIPSI